MSAAVPSLAAPSLCLGPVLGLALATPQRRGGWWPRGALYAADFRKHRYMAGNRSISPAAAFSLARGGEALAPSLDGSYQSFAAHEPARTDRGLFLSPAVSNAIPDNTGEGATLSTMDTLNNMPATWRQSRVDGAAISGRIVQVGSDRGLPSVDIRLWGTSTASDLQIFFSSSELTHMPVTPGSPVLFGIHLGVTGGSLANVSCRLRLSEMNASNVFLFKHLETVVPPAHAQAGLARFEINRTVQNAATAGVRAGLEFGLFGTFDMTLRLAGAHLEATTAATLAARGLSAPVPSRGMAVSRPADALTLHLPRGTRAVVLTAETGATLELGTAAETSAGPASIAVPSSPFGAIPLVSATGWA